MIFLKFLGKSWKYIAVIGILLACFFYWNGRTKEIERLTVENIQLTMERDSLVRSLERQSAEVDRWREATESFQTEVDRLGDLPPPEPVVRIREVIKTVENTIVSEDCPSAIAEAAELIKGAIHE